MNAVRFTVIALVVLVLTGGTLAQDADSCPALAKDALAATDLNCESTGRNQACYGNVMLEAEPQANVDTFVFSDVGDQVDVATVKNIRLSEMKVDTGEWGVALMRIQANLPDTLPGQNVTFLLFGDVEITNAVDSAAIPPTVAVTTQGNANLRGEPSTNGAVVGSLAAGDTVTADGRLADSSWLRLQLADGGTAWVFASLVSTDGDVTTLNVVDSGDTGGGSPMNPMQAFYFRSGIGDSQCTEAPDSGMMIQTPEGAEKISLTVNEVKLELGSTAFLEAETGNEMLVNVIEGSGSVEAEGVTQIIPAGTFVSVPMDENLAPSGPPSAPQPYDETALAALPVNNLERSITINPPLTQEEIDNLTNMQPIPGQWLYQSGTITASAGCPAGFASYFPQTNNVVDIDPNQDFTEAFLATEQGAPPGMTFTSPEPGVWVMDFSEDGGSVHYVIRLISPTRMEGLFTLTVEGGCVITIPYTITPVE
jgi:uncharacterized protein YraI